MRSLDANADFVGRPGVSTKTKIPTLALAARRRNVFRPAQIDGRMERGRQQRRHPVLAADAAAGPLPEFRLRRAAYLKLK